MDGLWWGVQGLDLPEVVEVKRRPGREPAYFRCRLVERRRTEAALLYVLAQPVQVAHLELPAGVATFAYYWTSRWYNVYHWVSPDGTTVAYYVNVATPAELYPDRVEWTDLGADVLGLPGGAAQVLDADELHALPASLREPARRSLQRVLRRWDHLVDDTERRTRHALARLTAGRPGPGPPG